MLAGMGSSSDVFRMVRMWHRLWDYPFLYAKIFPSDFFSTFGGYLEVKMIVFVWNKIAIIIFRHVLSLV